MNQKQFSVILLFLIITTIKIHAQINGTKTIGVIPSNYETFNDAVDSLILHGVDGPVTFNVISDTFPEQITIPEITGTSGTNTITFQSVSGDSSTVVLIYSPAGTSDNFTVKLDGANHIIFKNMTIASGGAVYANVFYLLNEVSDFKVLNCQINGTQSGSVSEGRGIFVQNYAAAQDYIIQNNLFLAGKRGIYVNSDPNFPLTNLSITDNRFLDHTYMGMIINGASAPIIRNNEISTSSTGIYYGIEVKSCASTTIVEKNKISIPNSNNGRGIYSYECDGSSGNEGIISNNFVHVNGELSGSDCYGIRNRESVFQKIYHNSVHVTGTFLSSKALFITSGSEDIEAINNIFINNAQGYGIYSEASTNIASDYNDLTTTGNYLGFWLSQDLIDLQAWQTTSSQGINSISVDPEFFNDSDLHTSNQSLKAGNYLTQVPDDIDGDTRNLTSPCIGADEFTEGALAGTYPLGPSAPDFNTFNEAVTALVTRGIRDAVIFNVESESYNEQITIPEISGVSEIQTITFQSATGDSTDVILNFAPAGNPENFTIQLNGADHLFFRSLTVSSMGTDYARAIYIINGASNNQFLNNRITGKSTTSDSDAFSLVYSNMNNDSNNLFRENLFENGSYAFYYEGDNGNHETGTKIIDNIFKDQYKYGIYLQYENSPLIHQNSFYTNSSNTSYSAVYTRYLSDSFKISQNIFSLGTTKGGFGIFVYFGLGNTGKEGWIANNHINFGTTGNNCSGIQLRYSDSVNVVYNSVLVSGSLSNSNAINLFDGNTHIAIYNNIMANESGGYSIYSNNSSSVIFDNNNLYSTGSNLGSWDAANQTDLSAWQTASGQDANSLSVDPQFSAADDPHFPNPLLNNVGTPVTEVTDDIDGEVRDATNPDIGADEFCLPPVATDETACETRTIPDLSATGSNIKWYSDGDLTNLLFSGNPYSTGETAVGIYTYYVTQTINESESQSDTVTLTIKSTPGAPAAIDDQFICFGELTPDLTAIGSDLKWYDDAGLTNLVHSGSPFSTGHTNAGEYIYYVTQTENGCESDANTVTLTIHSIPSTPVSAGDTICFGEPTPELSATGSIIQWYEDEPLTTLLNSGSTYTPDATAPGTYVYYVTQTVNNCESPATNDTLIIRPIPAEPVAPDKSICYGETTPDLTATGNNIQWYDNAGLGTPIHTGSSYSTGKTEVGSYDYWVTQTINDCESPANQVTLTINGLPDAIVMDNDTICASEIHVYNIGSAATGGHSYSWSSDPAGFTSSDANPSVTPTQTTKYYLNETIDATSCQATDSIFITINTNPVVSVTADDNPVTFEGSTLLTASGANTYEWEPETGLSSTTGYQVTASPDTNTIYFVTGTDVNGCTGTDSIYFAVYCQDCPTDSLFTALLGSFNHGCTNNNYNNNANCSWKIQPPGVSKIYLRFVLDSFDILSGDKISVYDGQNTSGNLLGEFDNDNPPADTLEAGTSMFVEFISNDTLTGLGFQAYWSNEPFTGIRKNQYINDPRIYPNPTDGILTIEFNTPETENAQIILLNTLGQKIIQRTIYPVQGKVKEIFNVSQYPNGYYFLRIDSRKKWIIRKVVLQK